MVMSGGEQTKHGMSVRSTAQSPPGPTRLAHVLAVGYAFHHAVAEEEADVGKGIRLGSLMKGARAAGKLAKKSGKLGRAAKRARKAAKRAAKARKKAAKAKRKAAQRKAKKTSAKRAKKSAARKARSKQRAKAKKAARKRKKAAKKRKKAAKKEAKRKKKEAERKKKEEGEAAEQEAADRLEACVEIKILRRVRAESSRRPPRHRRDACSTAWRCRFLADRLSQGGRVVAEK